MKIDHTSNLCVAPSNILFACGITAFGVEDILRAYRSAFVDVKLSLGERVFVNAKNEMEGI